MAAYSHKRLSNRGVKLYWSLVTPAVFTELANGSDFQATAGGTDGDGMAYEDEGHENPVPQTRNGTGQFSIQLNWGQARPAIVAEETIVELIRVDSDGSWERRKVLITQVQQNRPGSGRPSWQGSFKDLPPDPTSGDSTTLLAQLGITGTIALDPVKGKFVITVTP